MPTESDFLLDAQNWVAKWPEAVGHTNMLASFALADNHWNADCWYIFSDGMAHDPSQCIDFLEDRIHNGERLPVIHTVGESMRFEIRGWLPATLDALNRAKM